MGLHCIEVPHASREIQSLRAPADHIAVGDPICDCVCLWTGAHQPRSGGARVTATRDAIVQLGRSTSLYGTIRIAGRHSAQAALPNLPAPFRTGSELG